jgi:hypothetical protein
VGRDRSNTPVAASVIPLSRGARRKFAYFVRPSASVDCTQGAVGVVAIMRESQAQSESKSLLAEHPCPA